jgi:adenylosuccinate synthase
VADRADLQGGEIIELVAPARCHQHAQVVSCQVGHAACWTVVIAAAVKVNSCCVPAGALVGDLQQAAGPGRRGW